MTDTQSLFDALLARSATDEESSDPVAGSGLFVPQLVLGPGHVGPDDKAAIVADLIAVARARKIPLHPAVAWNCLYFGYDPEESAYDANLVLMELPELVPAVRCNALPVGALVQYSPRTATTRDQWAEVVYKEGCPPAAMGPDDLVRRTYSGAPGLVGLGPDDEQVATELLILDFEPLGPLSDREKNWLRRVREDPSQPYIDDLGHVSIEARYSDADAAAMSDSEFFCAWMLEHHHDVLAHGWLGSTLDDPNDKKILAEALANSLDAVEDILGRSGAFSEWNGYWYLDEHFEAHRAPAVPGGADAGSIVASLARVPRGKHIVYRSFSSHLREVVGDTELRYLGYARHAVMTGALVAEVLEERAPDGIYPVQGANTVLRRDDCWLFSGVWRAERLADGMACSLVGFPATVTLGLGASNEAGHHDDVIQADEEEGTAPIPEPEVVGDYVFWRTALRDSHRADQRLHVANQAAIVPGPDGYITLRLSHTGDISDDERVQMVGISGDGAWLSPVRFPLDFFTGIRLNCFAVPGRSVVWAATEPLFEPEEVVGAYYDFAFDRSLLDPTHPPEVRPTLGTLALRALIRHGERSRAGWRRLLTVDIAELIFGPDLEPGIVDAVASALSSAGRAQYDRGYWWWHSVGAQRSLFERDNSPGPFGGVSNTLSSSVARAEMRHRHEHRVVLHLRRLQVSEVANPERQATYREWRNRAPNRASLPRELPPGYTFVAAHRRGRGGPR